ncbi:MAG: hypothetical protein ACR2RF_33105 [Geminicoccaceae bacterium]
MGFFAKEAKEWKKTNPFADVGRAYSGGKSKGYNQMTKELGKKYAGVDQKRETSLQRSRRQTQMAREDAQHLQIQLMKERQANKEMMDRIANEAGKRQNYKDSIRNIRQMAGGK